MATPPPNDFSNHLAKWVYKESLASIVLVKLQPKDTAEIRDAVNQLDPLPENEPKEVHEQNVIRRNRDCEEVRCSTWFVIRATENHLDMLTCTHSLDHVFNSASPISAKRIGELFEVSVICDHCESKFHDKKHKERRWTTAVVTEVDCRKDLMLLRVEIGPLRKNCKDAHHPLRLAQSFPPPLETIVMSLWPPFKPQTACVGETSHHSREFFEVFIDDPEAYTMKLFEASILADKRSLGAPMLNGAYEVVGALHGGSMTNLCYFISIDDIRNALRQWGVIG
uniref:Uncharacterized protein n=1 Tax=Arundo donax TaxID=35708 RepID=A0A0A9BM45_ARUDO